MDDYKIKSAMYLACNIIDSAQASLCTKKSCVDKFLSLKRSCNIPDDVKSSLDSIEKSLLSKLQELSHLEYQILHGKIINLIKPEKDKINKRVISPNFLRKSFEEYIKSSEIHLEIAHPKTIEMNNLINSRIYELTELDILKIDKAG